MKLVDPTLTRRERQREETYAEIVRVSRELLREGAELSLRAVAGRMGMTAPALYRYVASYQELVDLVAFEIDKSATEGFAAAADELPEDDPAGRLVAAATEYFLIRRLYERHIEQALITVGLALATVALFEGIWGTDPIYTARPEWLTQTTEILGAKIPNDRFLLIAAAALVLGAIVLFLQRTRYGLIIRAGVENRSMVTALGIDVPTPDTLTKEAIRVAFDQLPEHFRTPVLLVDVEGLTYREAAEAMDVPIGTIMSRLSRGRALLRVELARHAPGSSGQAQHTTGQSDNRRARS